ncbi:MAG: TonB family protein [Alphaproteobacteria bacterium]|nr:TonB family protein [Alphaproteobacteria bacterium]
MAEVEEPEPTPTPATPAAALPRAVPPPQTAAAQTLPPWALSPPTPPRRPRTLVEPRPVRARAQRPLKPPTPDPLSDAPVVVKLAPVTPAPVGRDGQGKEAAPAPAPGPGVPPRAVAGLGNPAPPYPWISRRRGEQGRVVLDVAVTAAGAAAEVRIKRSSGYARLDRAAVAAVRTWRFAPARRGGRAVAGRIDVPITFRLTE